MPGWADIADWVSEMKIGKRVVYPFNKAIPQATAAGTWVTLWRAAGYPRAAAGTPSGSPGDAITNHANSFFYDAVLPQLKYAVRVRAMATMDCTLMIADRLVACGGWDLSNGAPQTFNTTALPRWAGAAQANINGATNATPIVVSTSGAHGYLNGDVLTISGVVGNTGANGTFAIQVVDSTHYTLLNSVGNGAWSSGGTSIRRADGVQVWAEVTTASTVLAVQAAMTSYTNQDGVAARAGGTITFPAAVTRVESLVGPLPLQSGDSGVRSVETITHSASASAGAANVLLMKPIAYLGYTANWQREYEFMFDWMSFTNVLDGGSLMLAVLSSASAVGNIAGEIEVGYG